MILKCYRQNIDHLQFRSFDTEDSTSSPWRPWHGDGMTEPLKICGCFVWKTIGFHSPWRRSANWTSVALLTQSLTWWYERYDVEVSNFHFVGTGLPSVKNQARPGIESDYCDYRADWYLNPPAEYQELGTIISKKFENGWQWHFFQPSNQIFNTFFWSSQHRRRVSRSPPQGHCHGRHSGGQQSVRCTAGLTFAVHGVHGQRVGIYIGFCRYSRCKMVHSRDPHRRSETEVYHAVQKFSRKSRKVNHQSSVAKISGPKLYHEPIHPNALHWHGSRAGTSNCWFWYFLMLKGTLFALILGSSVLRHPAKLLFAFGSNFYQQSKLKYNWTWLWIKPFWWLLTTPRNLTTHYPYSYNSHHIAILSCSTIIIAIIDICIYIYIYIKYTCTWIYSHPGEKIDR